MFTLVCIFISVKIQASIFTHLGDSWKFLFGDKGAMCFSCVASVTHFLFIILFLNNNCVFTAKNEIFFKKIQKFLNFFAFYKIKSRFNSSIL